MLYTISWVIDVYATSALKAAEVARNYQLDPSSIATVFEVLAPSGECFVIDLSDNTCNSVAIDEQADDRTFAVMEETNV